MKRIQLMAILAVLLAACSSVSAPPSEPVTVTFVVVTFPWLSSQPADYERLAEDFHEANHQVNVLVKFVSIEELPQGLAEADFLTNPEWGVDVIMTDADSLPGLAQQGLLRDLQPSLEAGQALQSEDFYPPVLDALRWQGRVYGLPTELDPWVMFYNQDLFDAAGVRYLSGGWHWNDFLETARALAGNLGPGHFAFGSWGAQVTPFVYQNGGTVVDDPIRPTLPTLDDPVTVEAVGWYVDLALVEKVMPTPAELAEYTTERGRRQTIVAAGDEADKAASQAQADLEQAVADGDVAMWMGRLSDRGGRWQRWGFRWGIVPLPVGRRAATLASVQGCFIIAHSEHFDQALRWLDYLTRQPVLHGGLPARRSVAMSDAVRVQLGQEVEDTLDELLTTLEKGVVLPESLDGLTAQWLQGSIFAVLKGEQTVEEALETAQRRAEETLGQE
jgi:ABC-type glycerol-3-phosphate transport system substrate-binding protein